MHVKLKYLTTGVGKSVQSEEKFLGIHILV